MKNKSVIYSTKVADLIVDANLKGVGSLRFEFIIFKQKNNESQIMLIQKRKPILHSYYEFYVFMKNNKIKSLKIISAGGVSFSFEKDTREEDFFGSFFSFKPSTIFPHYSIQDIYNCFKSCFPDKRIILPSPSVSSKGFIKGNMKWRKKKYSFKELEQYIENLSDE